MSTKLTVLSLFCGIGGARTALSNLGLKDSQISFYRSEISPAGNAVFEHHYPNGTNLGNVIDLTANDIPENVDLVIFGAPCLQLSSISPQSHEQLEGKDSKLYFEAIRIIEELRIKQPNNPPAFLSENTASMKPETKRLMDSILKTNGITIESGYHAPCRRRRNYWCSYSLKDMHQHKIKRKTLSETIFNGYVDSNRGNLKNTGYCILTSSVANTKAGFRRAVTKKLDTIVYANEDYIGLSDAEKIALYEERTKDGIIPFIPTDGTPIFKAQEWRTLTLEEKELGLGLFVGHTDIGISKTQRGKVLGRTFCIPTIEKLLFCHPKVQELIQLNKSGTAD